MKRLFFITIIMFLLSSLSYGYIVDGAASTDNGWVRKTYYPSNSSCISYNMFTQAYPEYGMYSFVKLSVYKTSTVNKWSKYQINSTVRGITYIFAEVASFNFTIYKLVLEAAGETKKVGGKTYYAGGTVEVCW